MIKHTPGPWGTHFHATHGHCITQLNQNGHPMSNDIAVVFMAHEGRSRDEAKANARLIAAAPELLGALQFVMSAHGEQLDLAFDQARAAIAKATGDK